MTRDPRTWFRASYRGRSDPEYIRSSAEIYWPALLIVGAIVSFATLVYAWERFSSIQNERSIDAVSGISAAKNIDREKLQATVDAFAARAAQFDAIGASKDVIPDPAAPSEDIRKK